MAIEQYFEEAESQNDLNREDKSSKEKWKSASDAVADADDDSCTTGFDCNICLDSVQDPVVTLCGHLYCWPCIYKWLHYQSFSTEQQCPVCKAEISPSNLVPLYGRSQTMKPSNGKAHLGIVIPNRPLGPTCLYDSPRIPSSVISPRLTPQPNYHNHSHQYHLHYSQPGNFPSSRILGSGSITTNLFNPVIGMLGEITHARVFQNSMTNILSYPNSYYLAGNTSPRIRRHVMQADKSLNRICIFLFCCLVLCLLLF